MELTEEGELLFHRLREVAIAFDARLRAGLSEEQIAAFEQVLTRLAENVRD